MNDINDERKLNNPETTSPTGSTTTPGAVSKKTLMYFVVGAIVLFIVMLVAIFALLSDDDSSSNTAGNNASTSQSADEEDVDSQQASSERRVIKTVPVANNDKLEIVIYEPTQNASNTTINFGVKNVCDGCSSGVSSGSAVSGYDSRNSSFLLDDENGVKYGPITDQDNAVVATPSCSEYLEPGEVQEGFVAFKKVPSDSTVSWVFRNTRIDGIKIN